MILYRTLQSLKLNNFVSFLDFSVGFRVVSLYCRYEVVDGNGKGNLDGSGGVSAFGSGSGADDGSGDGSGYGSGYGWLDGRGDGIGYGNFCGRGKGNGSGVG